MEFQEILIIANKSVSFRVLCSCRRLELRTFSEIIEVQKDRMATEGIFIYLI